MIGETIKLITKLTSIVKLFYSEMTIKRGNVDRKKIDTMGITKFANQETYRIFNTCINEFKGKLFNIWHYLDCEPLQYYLPYEPSTNRMRPRNRQFNDMIWKDHLVRVASQEYGFDDENVEKNYVQNKIYKKEFSKVESLIVIDRLVGFRLFRSIK